MNGHNTTSSEKYMDDKILPPKYNLEANSTHRLSPLEIQKASNFVKRYVTSRLESDLNLVEHTAPLAFVSGTGVNDDLDGTKSKSAVTFDIPNRNIPRGLVAETASLVKEDGESYELHCEVVQSLAKWKRLILKRLNCKEGEGIYCASTSIRKGYKGDVTHSSIADQWDYEIVISKDNRTIDTLKHYVRLIWKIITDAEDEVLLKFPNILLEGHPTYNKRLPKDITFITSEELHAMYPTMNVHERENAAVTKYCAIFIIGMGWPMKDGTDAEEIRAPDYDDWNINGDIIVQHPLTEYRHELSSMGIRVDEISIVKQLQHRNKPILSGFHQAIINNQLPYCYGGGIGISRLLMLLLRTCHIGEVQCGVWHDKHYKQVNEEGHIDMIPDRIINYDSL